MAPSAVDSNTTTSVLPDEVSKPPAGVVLPPKDIRTIIEKTAGYVARSGNVFEDRIREKERLNPKFSFLSPNDAYNPFYAWRLNEVREGRGTAVSAGRANEPVVPVEPEQPKGPAPPPEFHFSARMPNINAQDLEVVRLTALFVAKNGRSFMTALSQRETRNYQFDFLRPQHSLYQFFSRLVDQYTELLQAPTVDGGKAQKQRITELEHSVQDKFHVLGRSRQRAEWVKFQEQQKQKKEEEDEKEKLEYAQIDWHDFVVVETVLFNEADDQADLPPPTSLNELQSSSLEQKAAMSLQPHNMRIEEAFPTDDDSSYYQDPYHQQQQPPPQYPMHAPPPPVSSSIHNQMPYAPPPLFNIGPGGGALQGDDDDARAIAERIQARERAQAAQAAAKGGPGQPMRIRNDYVPRAQAKRQNVAMALCPNCKQQIPYDELDQHMRIELLDPRWKEQRQKSDLRQATTNLSTSDVAANLKRLASQRTDVFDATTGQMTLSEDEAQRRKRLAMEGQGIGMPPGNVGAPGVAGAQAQQARGETREGMSIEEQIRQLHQKFKG